MILNLVFLLVGFLQPAVPVEQVQTASAPIQNGAIVIQAGPTQLQGSNFRIQ